jgi:hypothetical protein
VVTHLPNQRLDAASTTVDLVKGDLADNLVAVLSGMMSMLRCGDAEVRKTNFRSFLIFSISPGSFAAKVSFNVCNRAGQK